MPSSSSRLTSEASEKRGGGWVKCCSALTAFLVAACAIPAGATLTFLNTVWETTLQKHIPARLLSRVVAYDWFAALVFQPLGYTVAGLVAAHLLGLSGTLCGSDPCSTGWYDIGGTSLASPLVAAQMALVQQVLGSTIGFANPAIYALHQQVPSVPRDVTTTARFPLAFTSQLSGHTYLVTGNRDTSLVTKPGYDDVTGLGSPRGVAFLLAERFL